MTLVEVMIGLALLGLVSVLFLSSLLVFDGLRARTRDRDLAAAAIRARVDALRADSDFRSLRARLRLEPSFPVPGVPGAVGRVIVAAPLREDREGMDLNLDGRIDAYDHSGDYRLLPVRVRVEWKGGVLEMSTVLHARE